MNIGQNYILYLALSVWYVQRENLKTTQNLLTFEQGIEKTFLKGTKK